MADIRRRIIRTPKAPTPGGPYSQAVVVGDTMYLAGQIGRNPVSERLVKGGIRAETVQVMENLKAVCEEAGISLDNVVKTTIMLSDMNDYQHVNIIYGKYFGASPPVRSCFEVSNLPKGARVEIEAVAVMGTVQDVE